MRLTLQTIWIKLLAIVLCSSCATFELEKYYGLNQKTTTVRNTIELGRVAIIKPFETEICVGDDSTAKDVVNHTFNAKIYITDKNVYRTPSPHFEWYAYKVYHDFFDDGFIAMLCKEDIDTLRVETRSVERMLHDSAIKQLPTPSLMSAIFEKLDGRYVVLTDFWNYSVPFAPRSWTDHEWDWYQIFIFDKKTNQLAFYENRIRTNPCCKYYEFPDFKRMLYKINKPKVY